MSVQIKGIKITAKLIQQTPMIHFQYDQAGAGIRGSELKPKLDRFLRERYGSVIKKEWQVGDSAALNYKVRVFSSGPVTVSKTIDRDVALKGVSRDDPERKAKSKEINQRYKDNGINQMYFGNMASKPDEIKKNYKETVFYENGCTLEITCLFSELRKMIEDSLVEFFAMTNFGTRQDKGFGGFVVEGTDPKALVEKIKERSKAAVREKSFKGPYVFYCTVNGSRSADDKMNIADGIYSAMKGGKNYSSIPSKGPGAYIKGYVQRQYLDDLKQKNTGSDKAFIKGNGFFPRVEDDEKKYADYAYVRAILGLSDHLEFKDSDRKGNVEISSKQVKRYQSPVTIKIIDNYILFIWRDTFDQISGKEFTFKTKPNPRNRGENCANNTRTLAVPDSFDPKFFIEHFIDYFEAEKTAFDAIGRPYNQVSRVRLQKGW